MRQKRKRDIVSVIKRKNVTERKRKRLNEQNKRTEEMKQIRKTERE